MAYAIASSTLTDGATTTSVSIAYATGVGDTEVVFFFCPNVSGGTFVINQIAQNNGFTVISNASTYFVAVRKINGTETGNFTVSWTSTSTYAYAHFVVSGVDPVATYDAATLSSNSISGTLTMATLTPLWNADFLVVVYITNTPHTVTVNAALTLQGSAYVGTNFGAALGYETLTSNAATGALNGSCGTAGVNNVLAMAFRTQSTSNAFVLPIGGAYGNTSIPPIIYVQNAAAISGTGALELVALGPGFGWAFSGDFGTTVGGATAQVNTYDGTRNMPFGWDINAGPSVSGTLLPSVGQEPFSATHTLSGICYYGSPGNFNPFSGVWVYLVHQSAPTVVLQAALTDADGSYTFYNLSPGNYTVLGVDPSETYAPTCQAFVMPI